MSADRMADCTHKLQATVLFDSYQAVNIRQDSAYMYRKDYSAQTCPNTPV